MSKKLEKIIDCLLQNNIEESNSITKELIEEKISLKLEEKRKEIASSILEDDIKEGVRPATMKFSDAHDHLSSIGYELARQSGSSHKVYKRKGSKDIILSPHGKDVSPASTRDVYKALKAHTDIKEQNEPFKPSSIVKATLLHIRREKVKEHDPKQYKKELNKLDSDSI